MNAILEQKNNCRLKSEVLPKNVMKFGVHLHAKTKKLTDCSSKKLGQFMIFTNVASARKQVTICEPAPKTPRIKVPGS